MAAEPPAMPEGDFGPLGSLSTGLREGVARGRATFDRNHIVRPAQGNTNMYQVPSQEGNGAAVAVYILEHINTWRRVCLGVGRRGVFLPSRENRTWVLQASPKERGACLRILAKKKVAVASLLAAAQQFSITLVPGRSQRESPAWPLPF